MEAVLKLTYSIPITQIVGYHWNGIDKNLDEPNMMQGQNLLHFYCCVSFSIINYNTTVFEVAK